jgi:hypothetical protein
MAKQKPTSDLVKRYLQSIGRKGGQTRAKNLTKQELSRIGKMGGRPPKGRKKR